MLDVALVIVAVAVTLLIGTLVPAIIELRNTLIKVQQTLTVVNAEAGPVLREIREVTVKASAVVETAERGVQAVSRGVARLGDTGHLVASAQDSLRFRGRSMLATILTVGAGLRAAAHVLTTWNERHNAGSRTEGVTNGR
jgi:uncharacterized protein YoxC